MKQILLLLSVLVFPVFTFAGESSEQVISWYEACSYSDWPHLPHIEGLDDAKISKNLVNLIDMDYQTEGFYKANNSIYTVVFDITVPRNYAILISRNCLEWLDSAIQIHWYEKNIQYSPSIKNAWKTYVIMEDWQYSNWANNHVVIIFDDQKWVSYIRNETLKKASKIAAFVKKSKFSWEVISYSPWDLTSQSGWRAIVEVRLSSKIKKNFIVKLPL